MIALPQLAPSRSRRLPVWAPLAVLLVAALATQADGPIAARLAGKKLSGDLVRLLTLSETFAHGMGVALILTTVVAVDPRGWRLVPRLATCAYGAGLAADTIKLFIARLRPKAVEDWSAGAQTFVGWLPAFQGDALAGGWGHELQSFPSGHAATGVGLAVGLSLLYPRARWWFATLALLAACQRIATSNHFLSDTLVGAAIGLAVGELACGENGLARWFDRLEMRPQENQAG